MQTCLFTSSRSPRLPPYQSGSVRISRVGWRGGGVFAAGPRLGQLEVPCDLTYWSGQDAGFEVIAVQHFDSEAEARMTFIWHPMNPLVRFPRDVFRNRLTLFRSGHPRKATRPRASGLEQVGALRCDHATEASRPKRVLLAHLLVNLT